MEQQTPAFLSCWLLTPLGLSKHRVAKVTTIHDVFAWSLPGYSSFLDSLIYRHWLTKDIARTDAIITVSTQSGSDIEKYLKPAPEKVHIIPYGVSSKFKPLAPADVEQVVYNKLHISCPYLLYVGVLTKRKNLERVLPAFALVRKKCPELLLVLTGPASWQQSPIEGTIGGFDLADHIRLTGPLTDEDLPALYNGALMLIFPSLYEGFGLPVLKAMACGSPVITSNISSLPEVVGEAAVLVDPYDIIALERAISSVVAEESLRLELQRRGLARASLFTWERTARETLNLYHEVGVC